MLGLYTERSCFAHRSLVDTDNMLVLLIAGNKNYEGKGGLQ